MLQVKQIFVFKRAMSNKILMKKDKKNLYHFGKMWKNMRKLLGCKNKCTVIFQEILVFSWSALNTEMDYSIKKSARPWVHTIFNIAVFFDGGTTFLLKSINVIFKEDDITTMREYFNLIKISDYSQYGRFTIT